MAVWVVIPAFNEERRLGAVLKETKKFAKHILVVDDGSADKTSEVAKKAGVDVLTLKRNRGKGFALRAGCDAVLKKGADILICLDADGQHPPSYIPKLLKSFKNVDVVFTWRARDKSMPFTRALGNWGINFFMRVLFGRKQRDMLCGFTAFTAKAYKKLRWSVDGYGVETEITANCLRNELRWAEIPIPTIYLDRNKGVKLKDAVNIIFFIVRLKFRAVGESFKR